MTADADSRRSDFLAPYQARDGCFNLRRAIAAGTARHVHVRIAVAVVFPRAVAGPPVAVPRDGDRGARLGAASAARVVYALGGTEGRAAVVAAGEAHVVVPVAVVLPGDEQPR